MQTPEDISFLHYSTNSIFPPQNNRAWFMKAQARAEISSASLMLKALSSAEEQDSAL